MKEAERQSAAEMLAETEAVLERYKDGPERFRAELEARIRLLRRRAKEEEKQWQM